MTETGETAGPLPMVIGVVGHRDLRREDVPILKEKVERILGELRAAYPSTPMILLSSLGEGADRLVAEIALALDFRLVVPLPMPRDEYIKDFPQTIAEFDALLQRADRAFVVSPGECQNPEQRADCYAFAAAYLARHSQILLALWDGVDVVKVGGSAHAVRLKLNGVDPPYGPPRSPLEPGGSGMVVHLVTPRVRGSALPARAFEIEKLIPAGLSSKAQADKAHQRVLRNIERFNSDVRTVAGQQGRGSLLPGAELATAPAEVRRTLELYTVADALALHFQGRTLWTLRTLLTLVFAAAVCYQVYAYVESKPIELAIGYAAALFAAYLVYVYARWRRDYQTRYLDYRALAEGLRVHLFWRLAGLDQDVADHYLRKQHGELDWIRHAIRIWSGPAQLEPEAPPLEPERLRLVLTRWVAPEAKFFDRSCRRDQRKALVIRIAGYVFFCIGLSLAVLKVILPGDDPAIIFMSLTLVVSILLNVYGQVLGLAEHANHYARLGRLFDRGAEHLRQLLNEGKVPEAQAIILELGKEALIENGDWLLFHRAQPVQVPRA